MTEGGGLKNRSKSRNVILRLFDFEKEFISDTDASFDTIGAVMFHKDNNGYKRLIAYES